MPNITLTYRITDEGGGFQKLSVDAGAFKKVIQQTVREADKMKSSIRKIGAESLAFNNVAQSIQQLQSVVKDLTDAYAVQEQAETQLATVMKQRMSATDSDIQKIKEHIKST